MAVVVRAGHLTLLALLYITAPIAVAEKEKWPESDVSSISGHYPGAYCTLTNAMLIPGPDNASFYTMNKLDVKQQCLNTARVWSFGHRTDLLPDQCDQMFDHGFVFTFFYYYGQSNYFHLHYDTAIPIHKAVQLASKESKNDNDTPVSLAFLPTVESRRLEYTNWMTDAFDDKYAKKYWNDILNFVAGEDTMIPLNSDFLDAEETICFKTVHFGTPNWKSDRPSLVPDFIDKVQSTFGVQTSDPVNTKVGILHRAGRRKILNEDELVSALNDVAPTELIAFDGLSFKQQVEVMQEFRVFIAMNGAGLMNCLYLPPSSTCIQLVPYKAELNFGPYGDLLKSRGPYLEWHNTYIENHVHHGRGSHHDDTSVHVEELKALVQKALEISRYKMESTPHNEL